MTEVIFNLSSISNGLEFSSVNYTKNRRFLKIGRVAWWLATCARKPKVPGSSPATSYVQR